MTTGKPVAAGEKMREPSPPLPRAWVPPANSLLTISVAAILAASGTLAVLAAWDLPPFATTVISTQNAYVRGRTTAISSQVSGYIRSIAVQDYETVGMGQPLVQIDDTIYSDKVREAQANLDGARETLANNEDVVAQRQADVAVSGAKIDSAAAELTRTQADLQRVDRLVREGSASTSELDSARAAQLSARAALREVEAVLNSTKQALVAASANKAVLTSNAQSLDAQLQQAKTNLGYTIIRASEDGELSDIGARVGQYVTNGSQLLYLVPRSRWVVANFKESQTANVTPGQKAWFTVDGLEGLRFSGKVQRIAPATGSEFSILRTDNAIGNFTKIPQRISVRIEIDRDQQMVGRLRPGMSVEVNIDTGSHP